MGPISCEMGLFDSDLLNRLLADFAFAESGDVDFCLVVEAYLPVLRVAVEDLAQSGEEFAVTRRAFCGDIGAGLTASCEALVVEELLVREAEDLDSDRSEKSLDVAVGNIGVVDGLVVGAP